MAAPALATDATVDASGATAGTTATAVLTDATAATTSTATTVTAATATTTALTTATTAVAAPVPAAAPADAATGTAVSFRAAPVALAEATPAVAATSMRLSAARIGADGTARIGVRLLSGSAALAGQPVTVEAQTANGWVEVRRLRTDRAGLAVGQVPFTGRTVVRAVFEATSTHAASTSPTATVEPRVVVQARVAPATVGARAVQVASQQAGKPYRYGSTGPSSFDCSGFTSFVYSRLGKSLPRTSAAQAAALPKVAPSAKQPGDLLFFRTGGRVSHVGIYAGGGKMWAAPTRGDRVKLQSIYSSRYSVGRVV